MIRYLFAGYFLVLAFIVAFVIPDDVPAKFINFCIIGMYFIAIFWWAWAAYPWWVAYWICALGITAVVTFGTFTK